MGEWIVDDIDYPDEELFGAYCKMCGGAVIQQSMTDDGTWQVYCVSCAFEDQIWNAFLDKRFGLLLDAVPNWICVGL